MAWSVLILRGLVGLEMFTLRSICRVQGGVDKPLDTQEMHKMIDPRSLGQERFSPCRLQQRFSRSALFSSLAIMGRIGQRTSVKIKLNFPYNPPRPAWR